MNVSKPSERRRKSIWEAFISGGGSDLFAVETVERFFCAT
jgi:hypothetical protein